MDLLHIVSLLFIASLLFIIWYVSTLNTLNRSVVKIDNALSKIDIALTERYDVLTKIQDVVKAYSKHEQDILTEVIKMRNDMSIQEKNNFNHSMDKAFEKIDIVLEKYPELKSSKNYRLLEQTIVDVEERLQAARRAYNANVSYYNQLLVSFPISVIANSEKMVKKDFFETEEVKKNDVKVNI